MCSHTLTLSTRVSFAGASGVCVWRAAGSCIVRGCVLGTKVSAQPASFSLILACGEAAKLRNTYSLFAALCAGCDMCGCACG